MSIDATTSIGDKVTEFLIDNPRFLTLCADRAREYLLNTGSDTVGMQAVIERVRWDRMVTTRSDDWKINNSFEPYLARAIMAENPDLRGAFRIRRAPEATAWCDSRYGTPDIESADRST